MPPVTLQFGARVRPTPTQTVGSRIAEPSPPPPRNPGERSNRVQHLFKGQSHAEGATGRRLGGNGADGRVGPGADEPGTDAARRLRADHDADDAGPNARLAASGCRCLWRWYPEDWRHRRGPGGARTARSRLLSSVSAASWPLARRTSPFPMTKCSGWPAIRLRLLVPEATEPTQQALCAIGLTLHR